MNRTTHPIEPEEVMAYLDGELAAERAAYVAAHIDACAECAAVATELRGVSARLATWTVTSAPPSLNSTVEAAASELNRAGATKPTREATSPLTTAGDDRPRRKRTFGLPQWAWGLAGGFAVLLLMFSTVMPNLLRSRITANETSVVGSLQTLITACVQYVSAYGRYPDSLAQLGPGNPPSENAADLIDSVLASGRKSGYVFTYTPGRINSNGQVLEYEITAEPMNRENGTRRFFVDQSGVIRHSFDGPANASSVALMQDAYPMGGYVSQERTASQAAGTPGQSGVLPAPGPMIIRTALLAILTREFDDVRSAMEKILSAHGGYAAQLNVNSQPGRGRLLKATVRIPTGKVDQALAEMKKLGRVVQESQSGEEITQQYVDLVARQDNGRHIEKRLVEVLRNRTGKVKEVLEVEQEIARVREEIERMEAKRKSMAAQVEYATVSLELREEFEKQMEVAPPSTGTLLWNAMVDGYDSAVATAVGLALFLLRAGPSLLLWAALLFFPARFAWRRIRTSTAQ